MISISNVPLAAADAESAAAAVNPASAASDPPGVGADGCVVRLETPARLPVLSKSSPATGVGLRKVIRSDNGGGVTEDVRSASGAVGRAATTLPRGARDDVSSLEGAAKMDI